MLNPLKNFSDLHKRIITGLVLFTIILHGAGLYQFISLAIQNGYFPGPTKWTIAIAINGLLILTEIASLFIIRNSSYLIQIKKAYKRIVSLLSHSGWLNLLLSVVFIAGFTYIAINPTGQYIPFPFTRLFLFWLLIILTTLLLNAWGVNVQRYRSLQYFQWLGISSLLCTFLFLIFSYYPDISRYPYTLAWSEASRYYYASLFFSKKIYGLETPPTVLHPSRYLLQAIPFLLPKASLIVQRAWQVFLWLAITSLTSFLIVRRSQIKLRNSLMGFLSFTWAFVFLLIGPVYYHLQVPLILVLWGFNRSKSSSKSIRTLFNLIVVAAASAWAGISRVNWFPVPGLLAALLWFIEQPIAETSASEISIQSYQKKFFCRASLLYGAKAVGLTILGTIIAFLGQRLYIFWSGNSSKEFTSSFNSDLLWYRLWPSSTYFLGILPGIILLSIPVFLLIWSRLNTKTDATPLWEQIHPIRLLGVTVILLVLLVGGLVVSVKIGGGSNLHNLDAYMSLLLVAMYLVVFNQLKPDNKWSTYTLQKMDRSVALNDQGLTNSVRNPAFNDKLQIVGIILCALIPSVMILTSRGPTTAFPPLDEINRGLAVTNRTIDALKPGEKNVLFLTNRHWLTFGYVKDVPLIPEYERVFLMEMAMAKNREYLDKFHQDLASHRFDLIISEPIYLKEKQQDVRFSEENNAWVEQVSKSVWCYYKPKLLIKSVSLQILVPRENKGDCK